MEGWKRKEEAWEEDGNEKKYVDKRNDYGTSTAEMYHQQILEKTRLAFAANGNNDDIGYTNNNEKMIPIAHKIECEDNGDKMNNCIERMGSNEIARVSDEPIEIKESNTVHVKNISTETLPNKTVVTDERYLQYLRNIQSPQWVPDNATEAKACKGCKRRFDWVRRKHHCRFCGCIFCSKCLERRSLMPVNFKSRTPEKVCSACYEKLIPLQQELIATNSLQHRVNEQYDSESYARHFNSPYRRSLSGEIRKAAYALKNCFKGPVKDQSITEATLSKAKGLAFITIVKGGFIVAGRGGTGLVIARLDDGSWSAPSAIGSMGISWGLQIGGDCCDFIIVLNTKAAVESFSTKGVIGRIGGSGGLTLGLGRKMEGDVVSSNKKMLAHTYTYARSKGVFAGVAIEVSAIKTRNKINRKFYGYDVDPVDLLNGSVHAPVAAKPLYDELEKIYAYIDNVIRNKGDTSVG